MHVKFSIESRVVLGSDCWVEVASQAGEVLFSAHWLSRVSDSCQGLRSVSILSLEIGLKSELLWGINGVDFNINKQNHSSSMAKIQTAEEGQ